MSIHIANGKIDGWIGEYVGRSMPKSINLILQKGSPLGNPFIPEAKTVEEHSRVCHLYKGQLWQWISQPSPESVAVRAELHRLKTLAQAGDLTLTCWCRCLSGEGLPCHAEIVKSCLEWSIASGYDFQVQKPIENDQRGSSISGLNPSWTSAG